MSEPRWYLHGERADTLVLVHRIEEGPLAEIVCHGDVDPESLAADLNDSHIWPIRWQEQFDRAEKAEVQRDAWNDKWQRAQDDLDGLLALRNQRDTVRRLAYELAHGNRPQLFEGRLHWYSPDENGRPHFLNAALTDAEVAEWEALEAGE